MLMFMLRLNHIPWSEWTSMLMSYYSNILCKLSVSAELVQCRKCNWSMLESSSWKLSFDLYASIVLSYKERGSKTQIYSGKVPVDNGFVENDMFAVIITHIQSPSYIIKYFVSSTWIRIIRCYIGRVKYVR